MATGNAPPTRVETAGPAKWHPARFGVGNGREARFGLASAKAAWPWRLFRREKAADGKTSVDLLFLPVWRGTATR